MPIKGIGTDIVKISRIEKALERNLESFAKRILHVNELAILENHKSPATFIAKRFAAKEAVAKALGTGIAKGVSFIDIEVSNNKNGQPLLQLHGKTLERAKSQGVESFFISLSDEKDYAIAYVILE